MRARRRSPSNVRPPIARCVSVPCCVSAAWPGGWACRLRLGLNDLSEIGGSVNGGFSTCFSSLGLCIYVYSASQMDVFMHCQMQDGWHSGRVPDRLGVGDVGVLAPSPNGDPPSSLRQCDFHLCGFDTSNAILVQHLTSNEPRSYGSSNPLCYVKRNVKEPLYRLSDSYLCNTTTSPVPA